jgi:signal transduction histidine kinase
MTRMTNRTQDSSTEPAVQGGVQPATSKRQDSSLTFEAALPMLLELATGREPSMPVAEIAGALHRALTGRLAEDSQSAGCDQATESHRLSRELHDRAAPAIAVSMHNLELFELYRESDPARAELKLAETRESLRTAFNTVRNLSARSSQRLTPDGLPATLRSYLSTISLPESGLSVEGDPATLPAAAADEIFLVLREAVRNAVAHAEPRRVRVGLIITEREFRGQVRDDGAGFDPARRFRAADRLGLSSMTERAELLGGTVRISSRIGAGTCVELRVPLPIQI